MIGLDSNIVLRAITGDDPVQSQLARSFLSTLSSGRPGVLNSVALVEIAWTLRRRHKFGRREVLRCIEDLMRSNAYHIVERDMVGRALEASFEHSIDFADALLGALNRSLGCATTMTFDRVASQSPDFTQLQ